MAKIAMKILVIDVGGTNIKVIATGRRTRVKFTSGPKMTARQMVAGVCAATAGWQYDAISIGCPGPVVQDRITAEPVNLGGGWVGFDFAKAFGHPVKIINDAAMQALGSYEGGQMLFLGLGTGLGSALVSHHGSVIPLELAHLPYKNGLTYEDYIGEAGLKHLGKRKWRKHVEIIAAKLKFAMQADYVVLGGGNARLIEKLPPDTRLGDNSNAFRGGFRLWKKT
jgi:polyphosphate glucokinase